MSRTQKSQVHVECYAGYRGDETPTRFYLGAREIDVKEVLDRWLDPSHHYFKLRGDDGGIYVLRHDTEHDMWELTLFDSGAREETRLSSA
jgi:hypothetical protein